jgi:hypothetical protein
MNPQSGTEEHRASFDWLGIVRAHGRFMLIAAAAVAAIVAVAGGAYLRWGQPTRTVASLEFRPTFVGLGDLEYPNGLPFSPDDVTSGPIIDLVYDANNISGVCDRETFGSGFFVEQRSDQSVFLDLEYESRLSEPRITMVERRALQEEHAAKRKALPLQYRLVFVVPAQCDLPPVVISKVMTEVLNTWATESETKRGVLKHQIDVLTPGSLDVKVDGPGGLLLRADLLRTALQRIVRNIDEVNSLPGAQLVRLGAGKLTFAEVQGKLADLVGSRLDPLVITSGRSMVRESSHWVAETVEAAERKQRGAEQRVKNYLEALRAYSGPGEPIGPIARPAASSAGAGQQAQPPALDDTFIDRIVELSEANVLYRQKLTDALVAAQLEAVFEEQRASYYRRLLQTIGSGVEADQGELERRLNAIVAEGKELTKQFGALYDEYSRVALRASASLYEARKPVTIETSQQYARRSLLNLIALAFGGTLLVLFGFFAVRSRMKTEPR